MKKLLTIALVGLLAVSAAAPALALGPFDAEAELPLYSKYVWRGMVATDDYVLQPAAALSLAGFKLGIWGNYELTDINSSELLDTQGEFTEVDYFLGWGMTLPLLDLGAGLIYYDFPKFSDGNTSELYLSAKANVILSPKVIFYQDLDKYEGGYWDFSIAYDIALGETTNLELTAGAGLGSESYFNGYFGGADFESETSFGTSFADARVGAGIPFHPIPFLTVTPKVAWTTLLGDAKDAVDASEEMLYSGKTDAFYWGLSAMFSF